MKVLVTGGAGFIGSNLVRALLQQDNDVIVLDDLSSGYTKNLSIHPRMHFVKGDIRDVSLLDQVLPGVEVIYHLAASVGNKRSIDNPFLDADINVRGTLCLLEAGRKYSVRKYVVTSSAGVFGELKTLPIREDHPIEPRTPYACSKLYAEKIALSYAELYDMEAICLRYFNVYGPHQRFDAYGNVIPIFVFNLLQGKSIQIFGDGEQTRDFVNVNDIVQANLKAAASKNVSGAFNIASGSHISINQLVEKIKYSAGINNPIIEYKPPRPGDVRDSLADINAAKLALGYHPMIKLDEGLQEYIQWAQREVAELIT